MDATGQLIKESETIFDVQAAYVYYNVTNNLNSGIEEVTYINKRLKLSKCSQNFSLDSDEYKRIFKNKALNGYYCFEPNQEFIIKNPFGSNAECGYLNFYVTKCFNKTYCKNDTVITKTMSTFTIATNFVGYYVDSSNYSYPFQEYDYIYPDLSTSDYFKRKFIYFTENIFQSDDSLFFKDLKSNSQNIIDETKETFEFTKPFLNTGEEILYNILLSFNTNGFRNIYSRTYYKLQNAIAEVGGFVNVIRIFMGFYISFLSDFINIHEIKKKFIITQTKQKVSPIICSSIINLQESRNNNAIIYSNTQNKMSEEISKINIHPIMYYVSYLNCNKRYRRNFKQIEKALKQYLDVTNIVYMQLKIDNISRCIFNDVNKGLYENLSRILDVNEIFENVDVNPITFKNVLQSRQLYDNKLIGILEGKSLNNI
jgi:hypothetical protein